MGQHWEEAAWHGTINKCFMVTLTDWWGKGVCVCIQRQIHKRGFRTALAFIRHLFPATPFCICHSLTLLRALARAAATSWAVCTEAWERAAACVRAFKQAKSDAVQWKYPSFPTPSPYFSLTSSSLSQSLPTPSLLFLMGQGRPLEPGRAPFAGTNPVGTDLWILAA